MELQRITNHPVHLIDENGNKNPTAMVPFCSVSDNYAAMGVKIDQMDVPVCNSFRPKVFRDQLCYTVDLNKIRNKINLKKNLFFTFFIDYNEDRDFFFGQNRTENTLENKIILETIGKLDTV